MTIVSHALELSPAERDSYLQKVCGPDKRLYGETAETVEWEVRMRGFLQHPMVSVRDLDSPFVSGETISSRFRIIQKLGEGGMGVVYKALDLKRNQTVAIKAAKPGFGRLLSPELEGALKVRHPNVCLVNEIHSAETPDGSVDFLTMELLDGETLSAVLARKGALDVTEALEIAGQLCSGLKEAHRSGVIHRDLKAGNVMLCRNAKGGLRAVITDFGLSGEAGRQGFFGTQRYMAPELLLGQRASEASDIYALGVILYEMLGGTRPTDHASNERRVSVRTTPRYQKLVAQFLSLEPERRCRAFDSAAQSLSRHSYSRREVLGAASIGIAALAGTTWLQRERVADWFTPLPRRRFVALFAWPPDADARVQALLGGAIDAIENELARAEAADQNLFVTSTHDVVVNPRETTWLNRLRESLGVNLALQASGVEQPGGFGLFLKLIEVATGSVIRQHEVVCPAKDIASLSAKAVQAAASLLEVHGIDERTARLMPSTASAVAYDSFQSAEELRRKPNDDGLLTAIEAYKKATDADPKYAAAYARLAMAYLRVNAKNLDSGALELARANALKAIELDRNSANGHVALAMVFNAKGDLDGAMAEMHVASGLDAGNPFILPWEGQIYTHFHRWSEAEQIYRRLQKERPNYWVGYNNLGTVLTNVGRYREALDAFRIAAAAAPESLLALNNLGALYFKLGRPDLAEESYRRSLAIKRDSLTLLNLAETLRVKGRYTEALQCSKEAVRLAPSNDKNWLGLADCYEAIGSHQSDALEAFHRAASEAERLLEVTPGNGAILSRLALYRMKCHSAGDSEALLQKAVQQGTLDLDSELIKVRVLELLGKRQDALQAVASSMRRGPIRFQIESIRDLSGLIKDARYAQIK